FANDSNGNAATSPLTFTVGVTPAAAEAAAAGGGGKGGGHERNDECSLGERQCFGDSIGVCIKSSRGAIWQREDCASGKTCDDGRCVDKGCSEDWVCSDWGDCVNGQESRDCQDYNKCGTLARRPDVTRLCQQVAGPPSAGQEPGRLSLPLEPITPSFFDKIKSGANALKFLLLLAILSAIGAVGYMLSRGPLPALLEEAEHEPRFEKAGEEAIYVPFSYVQQAKETIALLQSKPRKEAISEIRGRYAPAVVSLCLKALAEERKDSHTAKHPVLELYHDYISYETLHTLVRMLADARHHELDLALPGEDDAGVSVPVSKKIPEANGASSAQIQDGYVVLPESEEGPHKRAVVHVKLVDSKSVKIIQDLMRTGSALVLIDISHTDKEQLKTLMGAIKHSAKATDSRLLILDEKTIIAIGRGMTLA
ncbi:MAG TPA: hypothetical protein VJH22_02810, partial [Candidatus Nanoarchaeia archaeon]|nr:hypothetical protein [Candidatus Nanoarchaeia archaeon]